MTAKGSFDLRKLVPTRLKRLVKKSRLYVRCRSTSVNIYHCCITRGGSQWVKKMLSDSRTYRYSGLTTHNYYDKLGGFDPRKLTDRTIEEPFPRNTIVSPLYIGFENFAAIPKPEHYKAFYIMRDPRDLIVSTYFSSKNSHPAKGLIPQTREVLNSVPFTEGMFYIIQQKHDRGHYAALRSWVDCSKKDENVLLLRFEDLISPENFEVFKKLFSHCDIRMPGKALRQLLEEYSFSRLSGGRMQGEEDKSCHYRRGVRGDWQRYFNDSVAVKFKEITGDLVMRLGYEKDLNW